MTTPSTIRHTIGPTATRAGHLLRFGLLPALRPIDDPAYAILLREYETDATFAALVRDIAVGLGIYVTAVGSHGIVLSAQAESPFAMDPSTWRVGSSADDRLLDGLIQVAIVATLYPRPSDLAEDRTTVRPPVTVDEVEHTLRDLCERMERDAASRPDPVLSPAEQGLREAWRVYQRRPAVRATPDGRAASKATKRMIETALEKLREAGCFTLLSRGGVNAYAPTWRYQVQIQDYAVGELIAFVSTMTDAGIDGPVKPSAGAGPGVPQLDVERFLTMNESED